MSRILLAERGIIVSYETIRHWCQKFGPDYARKLKLRQGRLGDIWHLDEVFIRTNGQQQYLWRAVDQDSDVIDILVQPRRDQRAAERFFRRLAPSRTIRLARRHARAACVLMTKPSVSTINCMPVSSIPIGSTQTRSLRDRRGASFRPITYPSSAFKNP
jgi:transposase-like protein